MDRQQLFDNIKAKQSYLCVGLDTDLEKIPKHLLNSEDPVFEFNKQIIDATADFAIAYKPNLAFYEAMGPRGLESLIKTLEYIPKNIFTIADAKRGDIGNTSNLYARAYFEYYGFDAVTVAPYMGEDSVKPFMEFKNKWVILLALTSNMGALDFQLLNVKRSSAAEPHPLYKAVINKAQNWGTADQLMFVIGATRGEMMAEIRTMIPEHFLLVPGIGAQGGNLTEVSKLGMNNQCGLIINASRSIIYASGGNDFAVAARQAAQELQVEMSDCLSKFL